VLRTQIQPEQGFNRNGGGDHSFVLTGVVVFPLQSVCSDDPAIAWEMQLPAEVRHSGITVGRHHEAPLAAVSNCKGDRGQKAFRYPLGSAEKDGERSLPKWHTWFRM